MEKIQNIKRSTLISFITVTLVLSAYNSTYAAPKSTDANIVGVKQTSAQPSLASKDIAAAISNLNMATKALVTAQQRGKFTLAVYSEVLSKLNALEKKVVDPNATALTKDASFYTALSATEKSLNQSLPRAISTDIEHIRSEALYMVSRIREKSYPLVEVYINGTKQIFEQSAVIINGTTMVPLYTTFEQLDATYQYDMTTSKTFATFGSTKITLQDGSDRAIINGNLVILPAKVQTLNNSTMVPLRFVSEASGAKVTWDAKKLVATITSVGYDPTKGGAIVLRGFSTAYMNGTRKYEKRTVRYGKHDYFSLNQQEYDFVMQKVDAAVALYQTMPLPNNFQDYLNGARSNIQRGDRTASEEEINIFMINDLVGDLAQNGVSPQEITKVYQLSLVASRLIEDAKYPGTGAPISAYDVLYNRVSDNDSDAQVYSAVFDTQGYSTAVVDGSIVIKIQGHLYSTRSGSFFSIVLNKNSHFNSEPTYL